MQFRLLHIINKIYLKYDKKTHKKQNDSFKDTVRENERLIIIIHKRCNPRKPISK